MTNETKTTPHTPGPWQPSTFGFNRLEVWAGHDARICIVDNFLDVGVAEANARLISAAPDLLAALEAAVRTIRSWQGAGLAVDVEAGLWDLYQASGEMVTINSAIAKARGQAS